ncbi:Voltage-gated Ion Channel (VIC) Superfamily [Phytophthora cinnamomi]|uniref:Voltage-gated Ion Channel (VIC) Superfamily n=1 Tax=Phytophthora cinnamomi TaxID=4785 RepID=UPI003559951D|nr:Voltage-gated Ion Channel (VIC) Superfamily [Phytophthora cinnamomi]
MTTLSDAESPQVLDTGDTSHEHDDNSNTAAASPTPAASQHVEEKNHTPVVFPKSTILRGSRRHSSQMPSGVVHPVAKGADEVTNRARKRSVSTRGIAGTPSSSVPAWATLSSGLRRSVSDMHAHSELTNRRRTTESPYEEMMERFQIRQLQRTPSNMTTGLEDLLAGDFGAASSARTARTPRLEHYLLPRLSARNVNEQAPAIDAGSRKASFLHLSDGSGINGLPIGRPPLESGTSSLQLTEQYNLTYGTLNHPPYRPSRWEYVLGWLERMIHRLSRPISPFSKISQARYAVTLLATIVYVLWLPVELAFHDNQPFASADAVIGFLMLIDGMFTLHTCYLTETGTVVISHRQILSHYLKTRFILDALISVPLLMRANTMSSMISGGEWVSAMLDVLSVERSAHIMRVIRMIWLVRANQSASGHNNIWAWLLYSRYSHLFRIAGAVAILVCIGHYIACIWTILLKGDETSDEAYESWRDVYSANFYAALLLFQGEGVPTDTAAQNMFAALSVIVGAIVLAVMFGQVAVLVSNFNANTTSYQRKMEEVFAMTTKLQLPPPLRERIREYYEHLWHEYECLDGEIVQFSKELSHTLGLEVVLFKYMEVVMHVPFWKDCTPDFQKQLMLRLDVRVYLPNDFIMREGEVDVEFYMVNRGYCEIGRENNRFERVTATTIAARRSTGGGFSLGRNNSGMGPRHRNGPANGDQSDDGTRQSVYELDAAQRRYYRAGGRGGKGHDVLISRGQAFGDMALLMNYQRAANVRAITHVEMCVLSREDFQIVLARYPEDRRRVVVDMLASYMQTYELCKSRCPLLELVRKVYSPEAIAEACAKSGGHPPLLPPVLSARQAAERIYMAMNVETNDGTLKFGVGVNIRDELVDLREKLRKRREPKQQPKANSVAPRTPSSSDRTNTRVLKRMSSFVSDSSGSLTGERSPTRYADALFRRKSIELAKDEDWESGKPM